MGRKDGLRPTVETKRNVCVDAKLRNIRGVCFGIWNALSVFGKTFAKHIEKVSYLDTFMSIHIQEGLWEEEGGRRASFRRGRRDRLTGIDGKTLPVRENCVSRKENVFSKRCGQDGLDKTFKKEENLHISYLGQVIVTRNGRDGVAFGVGHKKENVLKNIIKGVTANPKGSRLISDNIFVVKDVDC